MLIGKQLVLKTSAAQALRVRISHSPPSLNKQDKKMKCPHCNYIYGYCFDMQEEIKQDEGDFFKLPVRMERDSDSFYSSQDTRNLYACPKCTKTFIEY